MSKKCILKYSKIPSIPIIGYLFYFLQLLFIYFNFFSIFYISRRNKKFLPQIIKLLEKNIDYIEIQTFFLGQRLFIFTKPIYLNLPKKTIINIDSEEHYYLLLWSLVAAKSLSKDTQVVLKKYNVGMVTDAFINELI